MKNILYFISLVAFFGLSSLFAVESFEEEWNKKINADELANHTYEDDNVDKLETKQIQETENKKVDSILNKEELHHNKNLVPTVESTVDEDKKVDEDFGNDLQVDEAAQDLPNVIKKENLDLPLTANLNENTSDPQKDSQVDQKIDVKDNELSVDDVSQPLEKKKEEDTEEKKASVDFKDRNKRSRAKPIDEKDEDGEQNEEKNLQKLTKLNRGPKEEWNHKNVQSKLIYKRQYDSLNEHLPPTIFIDDYSKQLFYCIKKNNLSCLRGIISKLEQIGLTTQEVLRFRNKLGDTPLIYAVKQSEIDIVRFLLLQGADLRVVDNNFKSPIDIAIKRKQVDIINAIAEMTAHLLEHRKISNKESSEMYDWARETKENNESACDKNQAK